VWKGTASYSEIFGGRIITGVSDYGAVVEKPKEQYKKNQGTNSEKAPAAWYYLRRPFLM
jgi:hypothetical protein